MHDGDFRGRGKDISRIEGLSDAVFGFAITLLAISLEVPKTSGEVLHALRGVPAFAITFLMLFNIWRVQFNFFRRYGLEDATVVWLNGALLFLMLVFVYPLKFIMSAMMESVLTHIGVPDSSLAALQRMPSSDGRWLFMAFGFGIAAVFRLFAAMHRHAYEQRDRLHLDDAERFDTRELIVTTTGVAIFGSVIGISYLIGALIPRVAERIEMVGTLAVLGIFGFVVRRRRSRRARRPPVHEELTEGAAA